MIFKSRLVKNIASIGVIQIANYVFPFLSIPIISRIIGPDKLGTINFIASFVAYFVMFIGYGFDLTATRQIVKDPTNAVLRNKVFSSVFFAQSILMAISIYAFILCITYVPAIRAEREVAVFTFLTCIATLMTQNWLFQAMQDLSKVAVLNLISKIIFTIFVLIIVKSEEDYVWQPFVLSLSQIIVGALSFAWAIKKYDLRLYKVKFIDCIKLLWRDKIFFFSLCVINLYTNTNILVLGIFQNSTDVGYYTAGQKLILVIQALISVTLTQGFFPYIGRAFGEGYEKGLNIVKQLFPVVFLLTFAAGIVIYIFAPLFIEVIYGSEFTPAIEVCRILAFVPMIIALGTVLGINLMLNLRMDKYFFYVTCSGAVLGVLLNFVLSREIGYQGSAYTWLLTELFNLTLLLIILKAKGINVISRLYFLQAFNLGRIYRIVSGNEK